MIVMKFGGSSLAKPESIKRVVAIVATAMKIQEPGIVVCSAFGGVTDQLMELGRRAEKGGSGVEDLLNELKHRHLNAVEELVAQDQTKEVTRGVNGLFDDLSDILKGVSLLRELSHRANDAILSFGERLCAFIVAHAMQSQVPKSVFLDTRKLIKTDARFGNARVDWERTKSGIQNHFKNQDGVHVATGFIASTSDERTTTLGRGGSDYTAAIFGATLNCREIQIWTDVDGVLTADPRKVPGAFRVAAITYEEAMELSHFGAKVIYPPTMAPAMEAGVPLKIKNTFKPKNPGTLVGAPAQQSSYHACGITSIENVALLQLKGTGLIDVAGISKRLFGALAESGISVILISQASSEHAICIAIRPDQAELAKQALEKQFAYELLIHSVEPVTIEPNHAILAVVGEGMRHQPGVSGRVFGALGRNKINVVAIAQGASELNISFVVKSKDERRALNVLHEAFFSSQSMIHLFVIGLGLIGKTLLKQIEKQHRAMMENHQLHFVVSGVANSRTMALSQQGFDLTELCGQPPKGVPLDMDVFLTAMDQHINAILIDCTASQAVTEHYAHVMEKGHSVVTPNKIANTGSYQQFLLLQKLASQPRVNYFYEANVGAGLPVIRTIRDMIASGDQITRIEAILSGTLSYLFNSFNQNTRFSAVLEQAREMGFTEPDPREDLSGTDVGRKLLILARECGFGLELKDISIENLIPQSCLNAGSAETFRQRLKHEDQAFEKRRKDAQASGKALRYIAVFSEGRGRVSLEAVDQTHPCYDVTANDNVICISSQRYQQTPMVLKGPGAGAEVTAAQVFAEIQRAANRARLAGISS